MYRYNLLIVLPTYPLETVLKLLTVKKNQVYKTSLLMLTNWMYVQIILGIILDMYKEIT